MAIFKIYQFSVSTAGFDKLILQDGMLVPDNRQVEQENERAVEMAAAYSAG